MQIGNMQSYSENYALDLPRLRIDNNEDSCRRNRQSLTLIAKFNTYCNFSYRAPSPLPLLPLLLH